MKIFLVDNAAYGISESYRWRQVYETIKTFNESYQVYFITSGYSKFYKHDESNKHYTVNALSTDLLFHLKTNVDDNSVFIFANARDPLVLTLHEYRLITQRQFKIIGYWTDSVHFLYGDIRPKIKKANYSWSVAYERVLADSFDINLISSDLLYDRLLKIYPNHVKAKLQKCSLPFDSTLQLIKSGISDLDIQREDLIILNTSPDSNHDITLFNAFQNEFPEYQFINVNDRPLNFTEYQRLLARAKVVISVNHTDNDPYRIVESMMLGCIPILPDIPMYKDMFNERWLYSSIIFKPPYLNFIRNREEIFEKIRTSVENYLSLDIEGDIQILEDRYYNSSQLKNILCTLIQ